MPTLHDDIERVLLTETQIQRRLDELAAEIDRDYAGKDLTLVPVLTGSVLFVADLLRRLPGPLRVDHIGVSSYRGATRSTGELVVTKALQLEVRGRDVLVVDDILDTGRTLARVGDLIRQLAPRSVRSCVFLEKEMGRPAGVRAEYVGFRIPDRFVVGYGLDFQESYRNLPYVATLKPSVIASVG
jgi:hypoxanthine phosphoribosyltransferase